MVDIGIIRKRIRRVLHHYVYGLELESQGYIKNKNQKVNKQLDGSEQSMMPILLDNQESIIRDSRTVVSRREFSAGTGIADVVMFSIDDSALAKRLNKQQSALTDYRLLSSYVAVSQRPGITYDELFKQLRFPKSVFNEEIIPSLSKEGLIEVIGERIYITDENLQQSPIMKCVAIEAKVKDWKGGIKQACRYKEFADEAYLAIYKKYSKVPLENIELFEALGIGLLIVDDDYVECAYEPKRNRYKTINRLLASERLISTLDNLGQPFVTREPFALSRR